MELEVYQGLESYLPVPKKQHPRSDRKLTGVVRSPQPSVTSYKRSPSLNKFANTAHFLKSHGRGTFYLGGEVRLQKATKGSAQRMKMLIFPWEYAQLSKRSKDSSSMTKEYSQRGNNSIAYSNAARAPKTKQISVYRTICPQPSLARSQFLKQ